MHDPHKIVLPPDKQEEYVLFRLGRSHQTYLWPDRVGFTSLKFMGGFERMVQVSGKGICTVCGCTELNACMTTAGPCGWANEEETLCSACTNIPERIMIMKPGAEMDKEITSIMNGIAELQFKVESFSSDPLSALKLWEFARAAFGQVDIHRFGFTPQLLSEFCGIGDEEDEEEPKVSVWSGNWMESLAKAFLLYHYECWGVHNSPEWEQLKEEAPKRIAH